MRGTTVSHFTIIENMGQGGLTTLRSALPGPAAADELSVE